MRHAFSPSILTSCLLGAVALGGCNARDRDHDRDESVRTADSSPVVTEVDIDDLQDEPYDYLDREVRVVGEVDDPSYGDHAFVIQGDDWLFNDEVLVLGATPMRLRSENLEDGESVIVTGTVWVGDMPGLERDLGWPIGESMADDWDGKAIIVAHTVRSAEDGAEWSDTGARTTR